MMSQQYRTIQTPCIGTCSTIYGDAVCRGCNRFHHEVVNWNRYTVAQKDLVWRRLERVIHTVLANKVLIADIDKLRTGLRTHTVRFNEQLDPMTWVYALLRTFAQTSVSLPNFGVHQRIAYQHLASADLFASTQDEIFVPQ
ncbi:MAG: DUF1289 domain-containing protein [Gammaproteobacteria bacterium]